MNVLTIFDQRISAIFSEGAPGARQPFSFKRLAKRAVREMEDETFVIDGVDTAPALYTVLVSTEDDELMRPLYVKICDELSQLIEAQAKKRGYTFVGRPLVRFMVDPALRQGRFSVFAENIDPRTLARLRDEENAYLGVTGPSIAYANEDFVPSAVPVRDEEPMPVAQEVAFEPAVNPFEPLSEPLEPAADPLDDLAEPAANPLGDLAEPAANPLGDLADPAEEPVDLPDPLSQPGDLPEIEPEFMPAAEVDLDPVFDFDSPEEVEDSINAATPHSGSVPVVGPLYPDMDDQDAQGTSQGADEPAIDPLDIIPDDPLDDDPLANDIPVPAHIPRHAAPAHAAPATQVQPSAAPSCMLVDVATGASYAITSAITLIGRENAAGAVVLTDPNVSRRHAELTFAAGNWSIRDLGSTNGTLVNDVDVQEARLRDGDVLTLGLTNLEFRAG